jgi:hypothetical protein
MSQYVVWFDSSETGAPVLNNVAGSLLAVIKACGVTGFNVKTVTSISVAGGVATASCAGHGYSSTYGKDVEVSGCSEAALNGRKALTYTDTNTFKFSAVGVADGTYSTGAITAKRSPLGWVEQYSGTNKSIFKRSDVTATAMMLRVDDSNIAPATATDARCLMVESATDVDTYSASFAPTIAQVVGGCFMNKGTNSATAKQWTLIGDSKRLLLITQHSGTLLPGANAGAVPFFFGDFTSFKAGDQYNCLLSASSTAYSGSSGGQRFAFNDSTPQAGGALVARHWAQVTPSIATGFQGFGNGSSGDTTWPVYPSPIDSGLVVVPGWLVREFDSTYAHPVRGILKFPVHLLARNPFNHLQILDAIDLLPGRKVIVLSTFSGGTTVGPIGVDLTGPWD